MLKRIRFSDNNPILNLIDGSFHWHFR